MTTVNILDTTSNHGGTIISFEEPNLNTMPEEVLLRLLQYVDDTHAHRNILALERTCRVFRTMLQDDNIWALFSQSQCDEHEEYDYPPTNRDRAFLKMTIDNIQKYQDGADNLLLKYLGGVDGVRSLTGKLLEAMSNPDEYEDFPKRLCISGDAIEYLVEVIQCNVIDGLVRALLLAVEMLRSGDGYPIVTRRNVRLLGSCCNIDLGYHVCTRMFRPMMSILDSSLWKWPEHDCLGDEFLGEEERQKLVRALAYRAGIAKMSGDAFSFISTVILHEMAVLMSYAADMCDGDIEDACTIMVAADVTDDEMLSLVRSVPLPTEVKLVITPHQIKDAAEFMGMQPILFGFACSGVEWVEGDDAEYFTEDSESDDTFDFEFESDLESDESDSELNDPILDEYINRFAIRNDD